MYNILKVIERMFNIGNTHKGDDYMKYIKLIKLENITILENGVIENTKKEKNSEKTKKEKERGGLAWQ